MGPHRRTSARVRGSLAGIEFRARRLSEENKFRSEVIDTLSIILKEIKDIKKFLYSQVRKK